MPNMPIVWLATLSILLALPTTKAVADKPASHCIKASVERGSAVEPKGWLTNTCAGPVAVVYGFDTKYDGARKKKPWCGNEGDYFNEHFVGSKGEVLDPGERIGVGYYFEPGVRFGVYWAACEIDTSANNAVFFLIESSNFKFSASCDFECQ